MKARMGIKIRVRLKCREALGSGASNLGSSTVAGSTIGAPGMHRARTSFRASRTNGSRSSSTQRTIELAQTC